MTDPLVVPDRTLPARALRGRPIVVATDGGEASAPPVRVAAALAAECGVVPHAVRAFGTSSAAAIPASVASLLAAADDLIGPDLHEPDVAATHAALAALDPAAGAWPVRLGIGTPASVVLRHATTLDAALVVMGLRRHGRVDRLLRDETTLHVVRGAACPVLGVTPALTGLPRRAVVGVDFGRPSARAARAALDLLAPGGTLLLAYVEEPAPPLDDAGGDGGDGGAPVDALGAAAAFDRLVAELAPGADVTVRRVRLDVEVGRGVAESLATLAERESADLIAVGTRRHDWLDRALLGSVTTELVRDGRHPILAVPPRR